MAILNLPVWPFEANWASPLTETLEWLSDVMVSPTGSEQRRALREFPRRMYEFDIVLSGEDRSYFENLVVNYGAEDWYIPLWHEVDIAMTELTLGQNSTFFDQTTALKAGDVVMITQGDVFDFVLMEVEDSSPSSVVFTSNFAKTWPRGTRIYRVIKAHLTEQPSKSKKNDDTITATVRFRAMELASSLIYGPLTPLTVVYRGFPAINVRPEETDDLMHSYERMLDELDNKTARPLFRDTANRAFQVQKYAWFLNGKQAHRDFENLICNLCGRVNAIWIPTFMQDFVLAAPIVSGTSNLVVNRSGFLASGGPRPGHEDIVLDFGTSRSYRRIDGVTLGPNNTEILHLTSPINANYVFEDIVGISFINLMRLNQDVITIEHLTDTEGTSTLSAIFRNAPDTRVVSPGF